MVEDSLGSQLAADIASEDLAQLQAAFRILSLDPAALPPAVSQLLIHIAELGIRAPRRAGRRLFGLPGKMPVHNLPIAQIRTRIFRNLALFSSQPIQRRRLFADELPPMAAKALYSQLFDKFAAEADSLEVIALYRNIPLECAGSIRLEANLQQASFLPQAGARANAKYSSGYYLAVLRDASGKLRRLLLRLE